jgi:hypothetical protein
MAKRPKDVEDIKIIRPPRAKLTPEEIMKRMEEFEKRKDALIGTVRKGKDRNLPS